MKKLCLYLFVFTIQMYAYASASQECDPELFNVRYRNYNTRCEYLKNTTLEAKEISDINKVITKELNNLPNNSLLDPDFRDDGTGGSESLNTDRTITVKITKTVIKREKYAGNTGKERYLIVTYQEVYYDLEIQLKDNREKKALYRYKKYFKESELEDKVRELYKEIKPYYEKPVRYCEKKTEKDYFLNLYVVNGYPVGRYRDLLTYTAGFGSTLGVRGVWSRNTVFSVYFETAYNTAGNHDINYAVTLQGGAGAGYIIQFENFQIMPEISVGRIYSYYNVKYSDMDSFYKNVILRGALEINTILCEKRFFIRPVFSDILENDNALYSLELQFGIKLNI